MVITSFGENPDEIDPKTEKPGKHLRPKVFHAAIGDVKASLEGVAQVMERPHYNVYMPLAVFRPDINPWSKGFERDVVASLAIVLDFDDANAGQWAERVPLPPDYVIQSSAGRYQVIYLFDKPEPPDVVKEVAKRLKAFARCDHGTSDISHVWRVPLNAYLPAYSDRKGFWILDGDAVRWVGVVLFAAGGALRIWPVLVLGRRFSGLVAIQPGHTLVTSGVYRIIRHPSYLGLLVNSLGWALAFRSGVGLLLTALLVPPLLARAYTRKKCCCARNSAGNTTSIAAARRA